MAACAGGRGVAYVRAHADAADRMGKPLVIEEVGHPRDFEQYGETASVAGREPICSASSGRMVQATIDAAFESAREKRHVTIA